MLNTVAIHGRLTATPELRHTANGIAVTSFSIAVNSGSGDKQRVDFIDCVAWRKTAEFVCNYFSKGQEMNLNGPLRTRMFEDRNGNKRKATEVVAHEVDFCGPKAKGAEKGAEKAAKSTVKHAQHNSGSYSPDTFGPDDDLPF